VLAVWLFVALVVVPSIGSIYFATGKVDVAAPLVCPPEACALTSRR
jgi:hypothetical protein